MPQPHRPAIPVCIAHGTTTRSTACAALSSPDHDSVHTSPDTPAQSVFLLLCLGIVNAGQAGPGLQGLLSTVRSMCTPVQASTVCRMRISLCLRTLSCPPLCSQIPSPCLSPCTCSTSWAVTTPMVTLSGVKYTKAAEKPVIEVDVVKVVEIEDEAALVKV